ncbi:MAG: helix-turn-helix transcriptional regulator [Rhodobacter sp.]|nr:helix-turn-helix transcriptional regulator [Paracoccaceae bacterium]MCC0075367.1 helix-turn-helix transcriptional regulator [Rhodobacter sp.]
MTDNWYTDEHATLGDRLAAARDGAGMTQTALAQRLGVRIKTLRDWENDVSEPRANRLQMLAALLGVSLRWLLTGEGDDVAPPDDAEAAPDPQLQATLAELRSLRGDLLKMGEKLGRLEKSLRLQIAAKE